MTVGEVISSLQAAVFPDGHPYKRPIIGTHQSLSTLGPDDVMAEAIEQDFQACAAGRPTLSIVGDQGAAQAALREAWRVRRGGGPSQEGCAPTVPLERYILAPY